MSNSNRTGTSQTYHFRRRTNNTSYDPYDCLTTTLHPSPSSSESDSDYSLLKEDYWSDGDSVHFFGRPTTITTMPESPSNATPSEPKTPSVIATTTATSLISGPRPDPGLTFLASKSGEFNPSYRSSENINRGSDYGNHNHHQKGVTSKMRMNQENEGITTKDTEHSLDETQNNRNKHEVRDSILAGSLAGMTSCSLFHPFDVVRTKMQASTKILQTSTSRAKTTNSSTGITTTQLNPKAKATMNASNAGARITSSSGPLAIMSHTYRNGGLRAFYTGISLPLVAQALYKSTIFTVHRVSSNVLTDWKTKEQHKIGIFSDYQMTLGDHFLCGSLSGAVNALLFVCPVEYVRSQLIHQHTKKSQGKVSPGVAMRGPIDVISKTIKADGIFGLWRGARVTLLRDSVGCGAFFIMNETGKESIAHLTRHKRNTLPNTIGAGFFAGFGYWFVSLPLDTLKTLVQTGKSSSALDTTLVLLKRDGPFQAISQLYRGWPLAFTRGSHSAAVAMTTYATVYNLCGIYLQ